MKFTTAFSLFFLPNAMATYFTSTTLPAYTANSTFSSSSMSAALTQLLSDLGYTGALLTGLTTEVSTYENNSLVVLPAPGCSVTVENGRYGSISFNTSDAQCVGIYNNQYCYATANGIHLTYSQNTTQNSLVFETGTTVSYVGSWYTVPTGDILVLNTNGTCHVPIDKTCSNTLVAATANYPSQFGGLDSVTKVLVTSYLLGLGVSQGIITVLLGSLSTLIDSLSGVMWLPPTSSAVSNYLTSIDLTLGPSCIVTSVLGVFLNHIVIGAHNVTAIPTSVETLYGMTYGVTFDVNGTYIDGKPFGQIYDLYCATNNYIHSFNGFLEPSFGGRTDAQIQTWIITKLTVLGPTGFAAGFQAGLEAAISNVAPIQGASPTSTSTPTPTSSVAQLLPSVAALFIGIIALML